MEKMHNFAIFSENRKHGYAADSFPRLSRDFPETFPRLPHILPKSARSRCNGKSAILIK